MLVENWASLHKNNDPYFQSCIRRALRAVTLAQFDEASKYIFHFVDEVTRTLL